MYSKTTTLVLAASAFQSASAQDVSGSNPGTPGVCTDAVNNKLYGGTTAADPCNCADAPGNAATGSPLNDANRYVTNGGGACCTVIDNVLSAAHYTHTTCHPSTCNTGYQRNETIHMLRYNWLRQSHSVQT